MAGLRVGYMLGNKKSLEEINDITRGGMGITGPSIAAASASMKDEAYLPETIPPAILKAAEWILCPRIPTL